MPLPETRLDQLVEHLVAVGLEEGDDVVVHSRLISFGLIEGGPAAVYQALRMVVGSGATIAVPTYLLGVAPTLPFDPAASPSTTGVFGEHVRNLPGARRSGAPIHSHAAVGPRAGLFDGVDGGVSFGEGSDFTLLHREGFKLLLLGCHFTAATFLHHLEALAAVPYRRWTTLARNRVAAGGALVPVQVRYFERADLRYRENFDPVGDRLVAAGLARRAPCPLGASHGIDLSALQLAGLDMLATDPYAFVTDAGGEHE